VLPVVKTKGRDSGPLRGVTKKESGIELPNSIEENFNSPRQCYVTVKRRVRCDKKNKGDYYFPSLGD